MSGACLLRVLAAVPALISTLALASDVHQAKKVLNPDGWTIPGRDWVDSHPSAIAPKELIINGRRVNMKAFNDFGTVPPERTASRVPLIFVGPEEVKFRELFLTARRVESYAYNGRIFCYYVAAAPYGSAKGGAGGQAAIEVVLAYYDDDGNGIFKTLEFPDPILSAGASVINVRLARWIEDAGSKLAK